MTVFCISGSLRIGSSNTQLLQTLIQTAPSQAMASLYALLESVPIYNPDKERQHAPHPALVALRTSILTADLILFSSPEYAHSLPGVLKNALDHLVPSGELSGKRVALVSPSLRGQQGQQALATVVQAADARLLRYDDTQIAFPIAEAAADAYLSPQAFWQYILDNE